MDTERLARLAESLPRGVTILKAEGDEIADLRVIWANAHAESEPGLDRSAALGRRLGELHPGGLTGDGERAVAEACLRAATTDRPAVIDDLPHGGDRPPRRWFRVHLVPLGDRHCAAVYEDISERHRTLEMLQTKAQALARSNAELEQFAYVASHDLQEPLRMVAAYLDLLVQEHGDLLTDEAAEYVGFAVDGALRMKALIRDLLEHSRIGTRGRPPRPTEANDAFDLALHGLRAEVDRSRAEVTRGHLPRVLADARQLQQLMGNLIANSLKFCEGRAPRVHVGATRQGDWWCFEVSDNGIGIEAVYFERIFQVFQRLHTRGEYEGTGIGLALCRKIVERHGGEIGVRSTPGEGSTFHFTLPAVGDEETT